MNFQIWEQCSLAMGDMVRKGSDQEFRISGPAITVAGKGEPNACCLEDPGHCKCC